MHVCAFCNKPLALAKMLLAPPLPCLDYPPAPPPRVFPECSSPLVCLQGSSLMIWQPLHIAQQRRAPPHSTLKVWSPAVGHLEQPLQLLRELPSHLLAVLAAAFHK